VLLESDQRFRGASLSNGKPSARLTLAYDHPGGAYAGASATGVEFDRGPRRAALLGYLGYSGRATADVAWEAGATLAHFAGDYSRYDYGEVFAGLGAGRWNVRLHHARDYFGLGLRTVYADVNAALPVAAAGHFFGHLGALVPVGGTPAGYLLSADDERRVVYDARLGAAVRLRACELQLAWVGSSRDAVYPAAAARSRNGVVLSASYAF